MEYMNVVNMPEYNHYRKFLDDDIDFQEAYEPSDILFEH